MILALHWHRFLTAPSVWVTGGLLVFTLILAFVVSKLEDAGLDGIFSDENAAFMRASRAISDLFKATLDQMRRS
jgi:hypothetical protein